MMIMKRMFFTSLALALSAAVISCGSVPKPETPSNQVVSDDDVVVDVAQEPAPLTHEDEEYLRAINNLSADEAVSKDTFEDDKAKILAIIADMKKIMEKEDFNAWLTYISPESIKYYSNPVHIRETQKKLPDKTKQLRGIEDYFKHVFIPARKNSQVTEIRYVSATDVKAVEVKDKGKIITYYQFVKPKDKWLIHIPTL